MKNLKLFHQLFTKKILLGLMLLFVFTCSKSEDDDPIVPDPISNPDPITNENQFTVDESGGIFLLPSGIEVTIPQGAVEEAKVVSVDNLSFTEVNALAPITNSENSGFLSAISIVTDDFDFKQPVNIKIPLQNMDENGLAILYELKSEMNSWLFSDETIIVNREDNFISIVLNESNSLGGKGVTNAQEEQVNPDEKSRSLALKSVETEIFKEDPCRKIKYEVRSLALDNETSEECVTSSVNEEITYTECVPRQTGTYSGLGFSALCKPKLNVTPTGDLKLKIDESKTITLKTLIGVHPLSNQEITLVPNDNLEKIASPVFTDQNGFRSFAVKGVEVGEGKINVTVSFNYFLTTITAGDGGESEISKSDPVSIKLDTIINVEVVDKLRVTTDAVTNFTSTTAVVSGNVTSDGDEDVTDRGVYYSTSENPESTGTKVQLGSGMGGFIANLADLEPDTDYYVKAYATNKDGTAYGEQVSFKTKDEKCEVSTTLGTDYECDSATVGGNVTCEGEAMATERGIYLDGVKMPSGSGTGSFSIDLTDLEENTTYTVQAYVTNDTDTELGEQISFTTPECELIDIDGNVYKTVRIGTQVWLAENLKTTTFNDGTSIAYVPDPNEWLHNRGVPAYTWYNNQTSNKDVYGAYYNGVAVETGKLCPTGWHVPSVDEYEILAVFVDYNGGKIKETGTAHWLPPNTGATDEYGFTALPGGWRSGYHPLISTDDKDFVDVGERGLWFTSTKVTPEDPDSSFWVIELYYDSSDGDVIQGASLGYGFCVRCVKD